MTATDQGWPAPHAGQGLPPILFWVILACDLPLIAVHLYAHLTYSDISEWTELAFRLSDIRWGLGPHAWLTVAATGIAGICALQRAAGLPTSDRRGLRWTGWLFVYLALVEVLGLQVVIGRWTNGWGILGLLCLPFLWRTLRPHRRNLLSMLVAFSCMALAAGLDWIEQTLVEEGWKLYGFHVWQYTTAVAEALELLGPALLFRAMALLPAADRAGGTVIEPGSVSPASDPRT